MCFAFKSVNTRCGKIHSRVSIFLSISHMSENLLYDEIIKQTKWSFLLVLLLWQDYLSLVRGLDRVLLHQRRKQQHLWEVSLLKMAFSILSKRVRSRRINDSLPIRRFLSSNEIVAALRPYYFLVHPGKIKIDFWYFKNKL